MNVLARDESSPVLAGGTLYLVLVVLTSWRLLRRTVRFGVTVSKKFFIDQFIYRRALRAGYDKAPAIRNIEHPLDARVPIRYEAINTYLGFVQMWISALSYVRRREGRRFNSAILDFMTGLERCYVDAALVYGQCLSTTRRPDRAPNPRLAFVYAVDPHLFCVPSLHVLVVCYTYRKLTDILIQSGLSDTYSAELAALRNRATAIAESILYVRQHSVNCIPTALSMLSVILPSFDDAEARAFLSTLFVSDHSIALEDRAKIGAYMASLLADMSAPGSGQAERYGAIVRFLKSYPEMVQQ
ncbi:MAG TPA: hypothetical protein VMX33_02445 [bacterium]|nr:hypothetical protein [bacterium]